MAGSRRRNSIVSTRGTEVRGVCSFGGMDVAFENKLIYVLRTPSERGRKRFISKEPETGAPRRDVIFLEPAKFQPWTRIRRLWLDPAASNSL